MGELIGTSTQVSVDASGTTTTLISTLDLQAADLGYIVILLLAILGVLFLDLIRRLFIRN